MGIPQSVEIPSSFGIHFIQLSYYFFAIFMPFLCLGVILTLFFLPMKVNEMKVAFMIAEICNAWSAMEVFQISVIVSILQLSRFTAFIVGDHCELLHKVNMHLFGLEDDTCFDVEASIEAGTSILFIGIFLHSLLMMFTLQAARQALKERTVRACGAIIGGNRRNRIENTLIQRLSNANMGKYLFIECNARDVFANSLENDMMVSLLD